uniref:Beta-mannosidase-like galactose-binding domain-containing protein n=1 Tax=Tetradesmus obliquus TaxID=3088 RepID=A0A383VEX7_TETOB|eukprot:jgi/Sobl393_1/13083/SZX62936.1
MPAAVLTSLLLLAAVQQACCLVRLDLTTPAWQLSSSNGSISLQTHPPVHVLGALAAAGLVQQDPLYRYGELETRWVSQDTWNFTVTWAGQQHSAVAACRHVLLVLHGIDTFGHVLLNGRHVLAADNAHRSWWVVLREPSLLREGPNTLSVVLQPAVSVALRRKTRNAYSIPTMAAPGGFDVYNFARKPASDFGWDWGPAFAPAGLTGGVELLGFDQASLIG